MVLIKRCKHATKNLDFRDFKHREVADEAPTDHLVKARGHARTGLEDLLAKNNKHTDSITVLNYEILSTRLNLG